MTGLADPVYVEGFLRVHSFDLVSWWVRFVSVEGP